MSGAARWFAHGGRRAGRVAVCLVLALLLGSLAGVAAAQPSEPDVTSYGGGMSLLLDPIPSQRRYADRQDVFRLEPGASLQADLGFIQWYPEAKPFRIFFLLNYRQANVGVRPIAAPTEDDQDSTASPVAAPAYGEMHHVLEFTAPPEEELYFRIWTEPLAPGYYDLALIVVPDPNQTQRELPYWTVARLPTRASVYVGDAATPPMIDFPLIDPAARKESDFSELLWFGQEPYKAGLKAEQVVNAGEAVTLTVNYQPYEGSLADDLPPDSPLPTAMVAIIDDRVVPFNGEPVLYGSAVPHRLSWLPVTIQVPADPGVHQVFIQQFPNPYVDAKVAEETGREFFGESSQRFILEAE